jgi:hypothetical protein
MKTCMLCCEDKADEQFKSIPYFTREDPKRKKVWCKVCQSLWLRKKKEMRENIGNGFIEIENKRVTVTFS